MRYCHKQFEMSFPREFELIGDQIEHTKITYPVITGDLIHATHLPGLVTVYRNVLKVLMLQI